MAPLAGDAPESKRAKTSSGDARDQFLQVYQGLRAEMLADPMLAQKDAVSWMSRMLDYNVPGGKLNRGMAVKDALLAVSPAASEELQLKADQIGWAIEFLQVAMRVPCTFTEQ
jgi:farnesyl diphosphate synthase